MTELPLVILGFIMVSISWLHDQKPICCMLTSEGKLAVQARKRKRKIFFGLNNNAIGQAQQVYSSTWLRWPTQPDTGVQLPVSKKQRPKQRG